MNDDHYCGFSCGDQLKKVEEVCNEIVSFSKHNPEYALVMVGKVMEVVYKTRANLIKMEEVDWEAQMQKIKNEKK
jgi:hypothetical protein